MSLTKLVGLGLAAILIGAGSQAARPGPGPIDTIADRLTALDRFTLDEDESGLDASRLDGRNWQDYDILFAAVLADGGLVPAVTDADTAVTLLAPNDRAFQLLAFDLTGQWFFSEGEVLAAIVGAVEAGAVDLGNVLAYHVIPGKVERDDVPLDTAIGTLNGDTVTFRRKSLARFTQIQDNVPTFRNPFLLRTDLDAGNSVIHGISRVLIPVNVAG